MFARLACFTSLFYDTTQMMAWWDVLKYKYVAILFSTYIGQNKDYMYYYLYYIVKFALFLCNKVESLILDQI